MKRSLIKILIFLVLVMGLSLVAVSAQANAKRIQFAKGKTSAVITDAGKQWYVFKIGDHQDVKLKLVSKGNKAALSVWDEEADMSEGSDGRNFEGHFENGGDYKIEITAPKGLAFTLTVTIK